MMGSASSVASFTKIDSIFTHVELPEVLVMNNSSVFKNAEFEAFVNLKWDPLPLKHPTATSGLAQRTSYTDTEDKGRRKIYRQSLCILYIIIEL